VAILKIKQSFKSNYIGSNVNFKIIIIIMLIIIIIIMLIIIIIIMLTIIIIIKNANYIMIEKYF